MFFLFEMIEGVLLIIHIEVVIEDTISGGRRWFFLHGKLGLQNLFVFFGNYGVKSCLESFDPID